MIARQMMLFVKARVYRPTELIWTELKCQLSCVARIIVSEWVGFNVPPDTVVISETAFAGKIAHTDNNETKSLTFIES